jgi:glycosyltransferase involved in cell wall biosynthesis
MPEPIRVCLMVEGSYPYITGGVSAWVQELIAALPDVQFSLFTISPREGQELRYALLPNVTMHRDIVVSDRKRSKRRPSQRPAELVRRVRTMHAALASASDPKLPEVISHMPGGYFMHEDAVREPGAWEMIVSSNARHNPIYPFGEYFWSWKASHDMIFTVIGEEFPDADLYHSVSTGYAGLAAVTAKLRSGRPFLLTEHGLYHKEREMEIRRAPFVKGYQRDMWIAMYAGISRMCYRYADLVVSLFEYNRRRQIEMGADGEKCIVIPNGIDIPRYSSVVRAPRKGFHVGLVGRVVPIKDIKTFILMAKVVAGWIPEARFWCIGPLDEDEAYYADCRGLVESFQLADRFTFTGKADVRTYYQFLDVLLLTSVREAQPLVILEAYAAGLPVVSTRVGNVPELLDHDERFLASPRDAEKLAEAVRYVHGHPEEMRTLSAKNRQKVDRFYDKRRVFERYAAIYAALGGRGR